MSFGRRFEISKDAWSSRIAEATANIEEVHHQRAFTNLPLQTAEVDFVLQTRGREHIEQIDFETALLAEYLPKQMGEAEVRDAVRVAIAAAGEFRRRILSAFAAASIEIPFPQRDINFRNALPGKGGEKAEE